MFSLVEPKNFHINSPIPMNQKLRFVPGVFSNCFTERSSFTEQSLQRDLPLSPHLSPFYIYILHITLSTTNLISTSVDGVPVATRYYAKYPEEAGSLVEKA